MRFFLLEVATKLVVCMLAASVVPFFFLQELGTSGWKGMWPASVAVGLVLIVQIVSQIVVTRRRGLSGVLDVRQSVTMTLSAPATTVVESFRDALKVFRATETRVVGLRHVEIHAKTRGNVIRFSCHPNPDGSLEVQIQSEPRIPWVLFDLGSNLTNVKRLASALWWREMRQRYAS